MEFILKFLLVIFLVLLNGFFVASEFALVSVRKTRINELIKKGRRRPRLVKVALDDLQSFISASQLGITIASLALGWVGEPAVANLILPYLNFLPADAATFSSHTIAVIIAFTIITYLHLLIGELVPKAIALQKAEDVAISTIVPLTLFAKTFRPFIYLLNESGNMVFKMLGFKPQGTEHMVHSEEEIKMILRQSAKGGVIEKEEVDMVTSVFKLGDTLVKEIMVPRKQITAFKAGTMFSKVIAQIEENPYSRFPIYEGTLDHTVGFVHIKDIYSFFLKGGLDKKITKQETRKIYSVLENKNISEVLEGIQQKKAHIVIVKNKEGHTTGLITLEDILERLVGEIPDEFEQLRNSIKNTPES